MSELLSMKNITKRYGNGVLANEDASFSLREGEIHAIAGENGAGKSTLMKILFGAEQPTSGVIELRGKPVKLSSPKVATSLGIGMVYQHFMLVDELPVYLNVFLGVEKRKGLLLDKQAMIEETRAYVTAVAQQIADGTLTVQSGLKRYTKQDVLNELFDSLDPTK